MWVSKRHHHTQLDGRFSPHSATGRIPLLVCFLAAYRALTHLLHKIWWFDKRFHLTLSTFGSKKKKTESTFSTRLPAVSVFPSADDSGRQVIAWKTPSRRLLCNIHSGSVGNPLQPVGKIDPMVLRFFSVLFEGFNYFSLVLTLHVVHVTCRPQHTNPMDYYCPSENFQSV